MPAIAVLADGKETVSHAGIQTTPGAGTQQDRQQIVVGAFDGDSGASLWSVQSDLPAGFEPSRSDVSVVGATGRHVVASVSQSGRLPLALVVDVQARITAWAEQGFLALGLDGTRVVGMKAESEWVSSGPVRALDVASLAPMWTSREKLASYEVKIAAPGVAQLKISQPFESHTYLLDLATGARAADLPDRCECTFDQRSVLVCEGYDTLTALDINTKQQLWRLPDAASGRVKPKLHSAFHGLAYTKGQRGPSAASLSAWACVDRFDQQLLPLGGDFWVLML